MNRFSFQPITGCIVFLVVFLLVVSNGWSQQVRSEAPGDVNNYDLTRALLLLRDWQYAVFYDMQEEPWEQKYN
ncbi:MAG: hypothetical protein IPH18_11530 [Chitinophagaceae bacterium]|nr:hypothetical protein [Chitinophagaceae bacterium]